MAEDSTDLKIFNKTLHSRRMYVFTGIGILSLTSIILGVMIVTGQGDGTAFWFIGLLVIFMTALATTSTVFAGLRMSNPLEAFGLPSGSVRALLAVGIMVMFVVFGLTYLDKQDDAGNKTLAPTPFQLVTIAPPQSLDVEAARYAEMNVGVVRVDATHLALFQRVSARSQEERDLYKQLLTAIVTLLTTVIGFYFGSRSASESFREETPPPPAAPPPDLAVERSQLGEQFDKLNAELTARAQELERMGKLPRPTDAAELKLRDDLTTAAKAAADAIEVQRKAAADGLARYDAAVKALGEEARPDIRKVHETDAREALKAVRAAVEQVTAAYPGYAQQLETLTQATAEG